VDRNPFRCKAATARLSPKLDLNNRITNPFPRCTKEIRTPVCVVALLTRRLRRFYVELGSKEFSRIIFKFFDDTWMTHDAK
jgi:hypothetical protein